MWNDNITYEVEDENGTRITCTTLQTVEKLVERIKKDYEGVNTFSEEIMLPFEFIIGSLFPNSYNNIKDAMAQQYIEGYQAGLAENDKAWEDMK
jgi:hypothetical protein